MTPPSRRRFLGLLSCAPAFAAAPAWALVHPDAPRVLAFEHLHTGERLREVEYFRAGSYLPDALGEIDRVLRDFRTGEVAPIDPRLLDLLHALGRTTGSGRPYQIISAYRSPATNTMLRQRGGGGVAKRSLHMTGQAIDIRVEGLPLAQLRAAALSLGLGGVGYYPRSQFVHVDTGRVRSW